MRRLSAITVALGVALALAAACGGEGERVEDAVRDAANLRLAEIDRPRSSPLRVVDVSCQRTTAIQDDVDQYYCDIRVADDSGAGFVDRDSEVFYSTATGTAELLDFPPGSAAS